MVQRPGVLGAGGEIVIRQLVGDDAAQFATMDSGGTPLIWMTLGTLVLRIGLGNFAERDVAALQGVFQTLDGAVAVSALIASFTCT